MKMCMGSERERDRERERVSDLRAFQTAVRDRERGSLTDLRELGTLAWRQKVAIIL